MVRLRRLSVADDCACSRCRKRQPQSKNTDCLVAPDKIGLQHSVWTAWKSLVLRHDLEAIDFPPPSALAPFQLLPYCVQDMDRLRRGHATVATALCGNSRLHIIARHSSMRLPIAPGKDQATCADESTPKRRGLRNAIHEQHRGEDAEEAQRYPWLWNTAWSCRIA